MEKTPQWMDAVPDFLKKPVTAMYDLIYKQHDVIQSVQNEMKDIQTEKDLQDAEIKKLKEELNQAKKEIVATKGQVEVLNKEIAELKKEEHINKMFIASILEGQDFDKTMPTIELTAKQQLDCEKVTFYRLDEKSNKFYNSDGDFRNWTVHQDASELHNALKEHESVVGETKAVIPVYSTDGVSVGVIVAENTEGFDMEKINGLGEGSSFRDGINLAVNKDVVHKHSLTDNLTQLQNRNGVEEFIKKTALRRLNNKEPVSVIETDIDHFKDFNDTFGHEVGDKIIKCVAAALEEETRTGEDCAFRIGGEELVVICGCDGAKALEIAERIRASVESVVHDLVSLKGEETQERCTISVGTAQMNPDIPIYAENVMEEYKRCYNKADEALYVAKASGRNRVVAANKDHTVEYLADKAAKFIERSGTDNYEHSKQTLTEAINSGDMEAVEKVLREAEENDSTLYFEKEGICCELKNFIKPNPNVILALEDGNVKKYFQTTAMDSKAVMEKVSSGASISDFEGMKNIKTITESEFNILDKLDSKVKLDVNRNENLFKFEAGRKILNIHIRDSEMPLSEARRLARNSPDNKSMINDFIRVKLNLRGINDNIFKNTMGVIKDIKTQIANSPVVTKLEKIPQWADNMKAALGKAKEMLETEKQEKQQEQNTDTHNRV